MLPRIPEFRSSLSLSLLATSPPSPDIDSAEKDTPEPTALRKEIPDELWQGLPTLASAWPLFRREEATAFLDSLQESDRNLATWLASEGQTPTQVRRLERELDLRTGIVREQWQIGGPGLWQTVVGSLSGPATEPTNQAIRQSSPQAWVVTPGHRCEGGMLTSGVAILPGLMYDRTPTIPEWILNTAALLAARLWTQSSPGSAGTEQEWFQSARLMSLGLTLWAAAESGFVEYGNDTVQRAAELLNWDLGPQQSRLDPAAWNHQKCLTDVALHLKTALAVE